MTGTSSTKRGAGGVAEFAAELARGPWRRTGGFPIVVFKNGFAGEGLLQCLMPGRFEIGVDETLGLEGAPEALAGEEVGAGCEGALVGLDERRGDEVVCW